MAAVARQQTWDWLDQRRMAVGGRLTQAQAQMLAASSFVRRRAKIVRCAAADLFWAWAAEMAVEMTRRERGHAHLEVPAGAELATTRAMGTGEEEAWDATRLGRVLRALEEASVQACEMEVEEDGESGVIQLTAAVVAAAWQSMKKNFQGAGGYAWFREYMVGGMLQGLCEGTVDADPQEEDL